MRGIGLHRRAPRDLARDRTQEIHHAYIVDGIGTYVTQYRLALRAAVGWRRLMNDAVNARLTGLLSATPLAADDIADILDGLRSGLAKAVVQP